jgi:hypothetical protein
MLLLLAGLLVAGTPLAEADVRAVVDRWLATQNAGDRPAYEALYAARFTGIRRSGPRTVRFDRAGWMRDRARMFGKPMTVATADLKIRVGGASALVSFTQTFAQGTFKDAGPKQMVVVREAGALKIASEKMLRSEIAVRPVPKDERFRFIASGAVLLSSSPDDAWAAGPTKFDGGDPAVAWRRADAKTLPAELARWRDRRLRVYDAQGTVCQATVKGFRVLSRSIPHFGTRQEWNEMPEAAVARQAWELGSKVLVGELDRVCEQAVWAQPATTTPAPVVDGGGEADPALQARALAALRRTDAWKATQKSYREEPTEGVASWDKLPGIANVVRRFKALNKGKTVVLLSVTQSVYDSCGTFSGEVSAIFEDRNGKLVLRNTPGQAAVRAVAAVDSDGDGDSELLTEPSGTNYGFEHGRLLLDGDKWDTSDGVEVPYMDCPC